MARPLFLASRDREPRQPRKPKVRESKRQGCAFVEDVRLPRDHRDHGVCLNCGRVGKPGDARHTLPDSPEQAEHRQRYDAEDGAA